MAVVLYWMAISHPSHVARKMLDLKRVDYELVNVLPLNQRVHLRLAGFTGGTVPALKLDGQKVQGSRQISRVLDQRWPEPPLFPADPEARARVEQAERWGEQELQPVPRRLFRFASAQNRELRRGVARASGMPAPGLVAAASKPVVSYYARTIESDGRRASEAGVRADLAALPMMLDRADRLMADGTIALDPPNAAAVQILATVRLLDNFADLHDHVAAHACAAPARELFADYRARLPRVLDPELLEPLRAKSGV